MGETQPRGVARPAFGQDRASCRSHAASATTSLSPGNLWSLPSILRADAKIHLRAVGG
jgi:hypothetical protein